jgi:hypothetical protein
LIIILYEIKVGKKQAVLVIGHGSPLGYETLRLPHSQTIGPQTVVTLSVSCTGQSQGHNRAGRITSFEKSDGHIEI